MKNSRETVVICLVLTAHVVVDLLLLIGDWEARGGADLFLLTWPLSQGSLIAMWAAISRMRSYLRLPAGLLGMCWTWFLTVGVLGGVSLHGAESAGWAAMSATQALSILILTTAGYLIGHQIKRRRSGVTEGDSRPLQFSLGFLLLWTTLLAMMLGLGRTVFAKLGWTTEVTQWEYFWFCPVLGACNAVFALLVLGSLIGHTWLIARILLATVLIGVLGYSQWHLFVFLFGETGGMKIGEFITLAAFQAVYVYATLLPLRLCGCFGAVRRSQGLRQPGSPFAPPKVLEA